MDWTVKKLSDVIKSVPSDKQRPGKEPVFTPEQIMLVNELACKTPKDFGCELLEPCIPCGGGCPAGYREIHLCHKCAEVP